MKRRSETNLRKEEQMLLALLRAALKEEKPETENFRDCTAEDWAKCRKLSARQGVLAIAFDGVLALPGEQQPPQEIKLKWAIETEEYEKTYTRYSKTADELTEIYARHGIRTSVMKGVGISTCYPHPEHRQGGDIDIYTYSADANQMNDQEANALADRLMEAHGIEVEGKDTKHSCFYFRNIPIENHKTFLNVKSIKTAGPIDEALRKCKLDNEVTLMNGQYRIFTPDAAFNTLFIAFHTAQHYGSGIALHHLCDWACILNRHGLQVPAEIKDPHFQKLVNLLTAFTNSYLGTDIDNIHCDEAALERLFTEIFRGPYVKHYPSKNPIRILCHKTRSFFHVAAIKREIFGEPIAKTLWSSIVAHLRNPASILAT